MDELELNDQLFNDLQDHIKAKNLSTNTFRTYSYGLDRLFKNYNKLSRDNINKILSKKNRKGQYIFGNSNKRALFPMINDFCLLNGIKFNILIPKKIKKERSLIDVPSFEEVKKLISVCPYPYNLMIRCIYGFGAGLRISEFSKLSWNTECINWVKWLKDGGDGECVIRNSKRNKSRYVNVPEQLMKDLYEYAKKEVGLNASFLPNSDSFIFDFDKGDYKNELYDEDKEKWIIEYIRHVESSLDYHVLRKYSKKSIGRKINLHQLRHSRASYLYNVENKLIEHIKELLGHKNIETTMIYVKISKDKIMDSMINTKII